MELNKAQLAGIVALAMVLSGAVIVTLPDNTYYCESRDMVVECIRLSSTGKTCYTETGRNICSDGWKLISDFIKKEAPSEIISVEANGKLWHCYTDKGHVHSYTKCFSDEYEGYLGEFI